MGPHGLTSIRIATVEGGEQQLVTQAPRRRLLEIGVGADHPDDLDRIASNLGAEFGRSAEELVVHDPHSALRVSTRIAPRVVQSPATKRANIAEFAVRPYRYRASSRLELWQCSAARLDSCDAVRTFFGGQSPSPHRRTRAEATSHVRWLDGVRVSDVAHLFRARPADAVAIIDAREAGGSRQQGRYPTRAQKRTAAQALNPRAKSPRKISTAITSRGGTS